VPREVLAIRVIELREAGNRLQLGVMTVRGVLALPIGVSHEEALAEPHKLRRYARWLTETINRRDIAFDATPHSGLQAIRVPKLFGKPETNALTDANPAAAQARFKAFQAIGGGLAILTFAGFVMMIAGGMFGDRSARAERRSAKAVKVDAETRVSIENTIRNLPAPTDVKNGGACPFEDKSYCGTLILATRQNDVEQVKKLLAAGVNPHERDANGWSPWAYALSRSNAATIDAFIDIEVPVRGVQDLPFNGTQRQSVPPLVFALGHGNAGAVQTLIKRGADPNERGPYGYPAANFAAYYGNVAALKALKESGIDLLAATPPGLPHDGETFLMHAAEGGKAEAVDYLLSLGANASDRDPRGKNAGDHAKAYGHAALAEKLWAREKK
jgi:Ankyrin repeats (3 copies)